MKTLSELRDGQRKREKEQSSLSNKTEHVTKMMKEMKRERAKTSEIVLLVRVRDTKTVRRKSGRRRQLKLSGQRSWTVQVVRIWVLMQNCHSMAWEACRQTLAATSSSEPRSSLQQLLGEATFPLRVLSEELIEKVPKKMVLLPFGCRGRTLFTIQMLLSMSTRTCYSHSTHINAQKSLRNETARIQLHEMEKTNNKDIVSAMQESQEQTMDQGSNQHDQPVHTQASS